MASDDYDSSSEENLQRSKNQSRRRSSSHDRSSRIAPNASNGHMMNTVTGSERDLSKVTKVRVRTSNNNLEASPQQPQQPQQQPQALTKESFKPRTKMKTTTMIVTSDMEHDVVRAPLNWQLVEHTISQLGKASDDLVQLYKRISLDYDMEDGERAKMLQKLAFMAGVSQHTLKPVNPEPSGKSSYVQHLKLDSYARQPPQPQQSNPGSSSSLQHQGPSWC